MFFEALMIRPLVFVVTLWLGACCPVWAAEGGKKPVPADTAQKSALEVVAEVYKPDYERAKTAVQKAELAKKLIDEGVATKDNSDTRFVLFRVARDIAAQQGDLTTAFQAIGCIQAEYQIDRLQMEFVAAEIAINALKTDKERMDAASLLAGRLREAAHADQYQLAKEFTELALKCAENARSAELTKRLKNRMGELNEAEVEFAGIQDSLVTLQSRAADRAANSAVGKYYCFTKGDWDRGVAMLALGDDEKLKAAAALELAEAPDPLKIGDAWWEVAEGLVGARQVRVQAHAAESFRVALPKLSGLTKTRIERYLAAVQPLPSDILGAGTFPAIGGWWQEAPHVFIALKQTENSFRGYTAYTHPKAGVIKAELDGTISPDGDVVINFRHTQCPPDWQKFQKRTAKLSADGKIIKGSVALDAGGIAGFEWKQQSPDNAYVGSWLTPKGHVIVVAPGGNVATSLNGRGRWVVRGDDLVVTWSDGKVEVHNAYTTGWKRQATK